MTIEGAVVVAMKEAVAMMTGVNEAVEVAGAAGTKTDVVETVTTTGVEAMERVEEGGTMIGETKTVEIFTTVIRIKKHKEI
jgi:hypothetical protein